MQRRALLKKETLDENDLARLIGSLTNASPRLLPSSQIFGVGRVMRQRSI
jgi:hypothetical protein